MSKEYKLVVDFGKPYEEILDENKLMDELKKLEARCIEDEPPYCDIWVYDDKDIDVTDKVFKKYRKEE